MRWVLAKKFIMPNVDKLPISWDPVKISQELRKRLDTDFMDGRSILDHVALFQAAKPRSLEVLSFQH